MDKNHFEGWYFKHTGRDGALCIIVGENSSGGKKGAFMQIISEGFARYIHFDIQDYYCDKKNFFIRLGESYFSKTSAVLNYSEDGIEIKGQIKYGNFSPIKGDIMGFFAHIPSMECYHGIVSTSHELSGEVMLCGKLMSFERGTGYIESDMGSSFPRRYLWLHSNNFSPLPCTLTAAIAEIPLGKIRFIGCIIHLNAAGQELCFVTYNGVRLIANSHCKVIVEQNGYRLELRYHAPNSQELIAPSNGGMNRKIMECVSGTIELKLFHKGDLVLEATGENAGIESVKPQKSPNAYKNLGGKKAFI